MTCTYLTMISHCVFDARQDTRKMNLRLQRFQNRIQCRNHHNGDCMYVTNMRRLIFYEMISSVFRTISRFLFDNNNRKKCETIQLRLYDLSRHD